MGVVFRSAARKSGAQAFIGLSIKPLYKATITFRRLGGSKALPKLLISPNDLNPIASIWLRVQRLFLCCES